MGGTLKEPGMNFTPRPLQAFTSEPTVVTPSYRMNESSTTALYSAVKWAEAGVHTLRNPGSSVWYKLKDTMLGRGSDGFLSPLNDRDAVSAFTAVEPQILLVEHNWAAVFEGAEDFDDGDYPLPYERCCFEFLLNDRRLCVLASQVYGEIPDLRLYVYLDENWVGVSIEVEKDRFSALRAAVALNIRAICIALDAEIAYTHPVRAPYKLNEARVKTGKSLLPDYRVVKLRSTPRAAPAESEPTGVKRRLHFRRGHWRHFAVHKTWIRWTLVGDPDMSFVDKYYRA